MTALLCLGLGYCARRYVERFGARFDRVVATARTPQRAIERIGGSAVEVLRFDGQHAVPELVDALAQACALLVSIPPSLNGDPALRLIESARVRSRHAIVYLSSVGVYGDHGGAWVDETMVARPTSDRTQTRLAAEDGWRAWSHQHRLPLAVLRLAGIYGPGRNVLISLTRGRAPRVVKPGQVFNRIHADDIAATIEAVFDRHGTGDFNVADDEPAPPQDVIAFAAGLLGINPGPAVPFADAAKTLSEIALSFYADNRRVSNRKLKRELGVALSFPTYRDGIRALFEAGDHRRATTP